MTYILQGKNHVSVLPDFSETVATGDAVATISASHIRSNDHALAFLPEGDPKSAVYPFELGISLCHRYESTGRLEDLRNALAALRNAITFGANDNEARPEHYRAVSSLLVDCCRRIDDLFHVLLQFPVHVLRTRGEKSGLGKHVKLFLNAYRHW